MSEFVEDESCDEETGVRAPRPRYRLADLIRDISPGNQPEPLDFPPVGEELL